MSAETSSAAGAIARERELFLAAIEKPASERSAFLATVCGADAVMRQRLEDLLREEEDLGKFLETPAMAGLTAVGAPAPALVLASSPGDRIDRYKLLQKIGEGGVGVVFMAEQEEPVRRRVALKVIKLGMDTKSVIARFEAERQALAMMEHPNIARVLDAGTTSSGRPYFVMELVRGIKITEYCDENRLPTRERLALFIQVCHAIQHAHQKGIIHRDIKPSNIMVTLHDGIPVPKVIDFGIAKAIEQRLTDKTLFTEFSMFIGTPAYMSPEQAQLSGLDIDTRSDIYALGVLLYELLTGRTPFDPHTLMQAGLDECRRAIREQEPARPSTRLATLVEAELTTTANQRSAASPQLIHLLRGDLDWIAMKCLEKDRTRRYATANDLAQDVQRYLDGDPVQARPPSTWYRLQKFTRRHRGVIGAAAGITITLLAGATISTWLAVRALRAERQALTAQGREQQLRRQAERERARALQERGFARVNEYVADINLAHQSLSAGNLARAFQLLEKHRPRAGETDLRGFEWRYLWQQCRGDEHVSLPNQEGPIQALATAAGSELLAVGLRDKITIWNVRTRTLVATLPKGGTSLAFLPGGRKLATMGMANVRIWNADDWREEKNLGETSGPLAIAPNGRRLATVNREGVCVWNTETWEQVRVIEGAWGPTAFAPDGQAIVTDSSAGLTVWPLNNPGARVPLQNSTNLFARGGPWFRNDRVLMFSADGRQVVSARNTLSERGVFVLGIWDARTGQETGTLPDDPEHIVHTGAISGIALSPDGRLLATASMDRSLQVWDLNARQTVASFQGHLAEVWAATFASDGQTLISGAKDGAVNLWPVNRPKKKDDVLPDLVKPLAFNPAGTRLAALNREDAVTLINLATAESEQAFPLERRRGRFGPLPLPALSLSADLRTLACAIEDGRVKLWNTETREFTILKVADNSVDFVALTPDGRTLVAASRFQGLRCWDLRAGTSAVLDTSAFPLLLSPDGQTLVALARDNLIELWDVATHTRRLTIVSDSQPGMVAACSPDGKILAMVGFDDSVRLWDMRTGQVLGICTGHKQAVFSVAFSPDGKTLATAADDSTLKLWNVATQQELLTLRRLGGALRNLLFSPDGRLLAGRSGSFTPEGLRFYRAPLLVDPAP